MRLDGGEEEPGALMREMQAAYDLEGTDKPFHGIWVIVVAALGAVLAAIGVSLSSLATHARGAAEKTLRAAGILFACGAVIVLLDGAPGNFRTAERGTGFWLTLVLTLAACFCVTLASARIAKDEGASAQAEGPGAGEEKASSD